MKRKEFPADFRVIALAREAEQLRLSGRAGYSYGKLVADTTVEERDTIEEKWRGYFIRKAQRAAKAMQAQIAGKKPDRPQK